MSHVPGINDLIELILSDDRAFRSRVEGKIDDVLIVAAPIGVGDLEPPEISTVLTLGWVTDKSRQVVPVELISLTREQPPRWTVKLAGPAHEENRRRFMRGGGGKPARTVTIGGTANPDPITAEIVDLSEGGLRCRAYAFDDPAGGRVKVTLTLDDGPITIDGVLLAVRQPVESSGVDVVVTFDLDERDAQRIRRHLYQLEMEERRRRLYGE